MEICYRIFIFLNWAQYVTCDSFRGSSFSDKLGILEEDIESMNNKIFRMERSRKTDLRIFEHNINLRIKEMVSEVLSDVILDKVMTGEITGVVRDGDNSLIKRQNQQIHQLKTLVAGVLREKHPVVIVPRKANSQTKSKRLSRKVNKIQNQIKELKDEIVHSNLKIFDLENQLRRREKEKTIVKAPSVASTRFNPIETTTKASNFQPVTKKAKNNGGRTVHHKCVGESIIMACQSQRPVNWYRDDELLSYGLKILGSGDRVSIVHDYSLEFDLQIRSLRESDSGQYKCESGTYTREQLRRHVLSVTPC